MSGDLLEAMVASARRSADERERRAPRADLERQLAASRRPQGQAFRASLAAGGIRVIAECKRRSPSRGILRDVYDAPAIAKAYEAAGAAAISVLTEPTFFDGSLEHLQAVRAAVTIPVLRKDFIVTPYQVIEAAAAGADAVLLIVAALEDRALRELAATAAKLDLATLVEIHDVSELARARDCGAQVIGVNSRNLRALTVDTGVFDVIATRVSAAPSAGQPAPILVAESGLKTAADLARLRGAGYQAFLIGERFMTDADPGRALAELRAGAEGVSA
jgi:indole-3-glycerol phosphate synthase